jgi:hypothetical protein
MTSFVSWPFVEFEFEFEFRVKFESAGLDDFSRRGASWGSKPEPEPEPRYV